MAKSPRRQEQELRTGEVVPTSRPADRFVFARAPRIDFRRSTTNFRRAFEDLASAGVDALVWKKSVQVEEADVVWDALSAELEATGEGRDENIGDWYGRIAKDPRVEALSPYGRIALFENAGADFHSRWKAATEVALKVNSEGALHINEDTDTPNGTEPMENVGSRVWSEMMASVRASNPELADNEYFNRSALKQKSASQARMYQLAAIYSADIDMERKRASFTVRQADELTKTAALEASADAPSLGFEAGAFNFLPEEETLKYKVAEFYKQARLQNIGKPSKILYSIFSTTIDEVRNELGFEEALEDLKLWEDIPTGPGKKAPTLSTDLRYKADFLAKERELIKGVDVDKRSRTLNRAADAAKATDDFLAEDENGKKVFEFLASGNGSGWVKFITNTENRKAIFEALGHEGATKLIQQVDIGIERHKAISNRVKETRKEDAELAYNTIVGSWLAGDITQEEALRQFDKYKDDLGLDWLRLRKGLSSLAGDNRKNYANSPKGASGALLVNNAIIALKKDSGSFAQDTRTVIESEIALSHAKYVRDSTAASVEYDPDAMYELQVAQAKSIDEYRASLQSQLSIIKAVDGIYIKNKFASALDFIKSNKDNLSEADYVRLRARDTERFVAGQTFQNKFISKFTATQNRFAFAKDPLLRDAFIARGQGAYHKDAGGSATINGKTILGNFKQGAFTLNSSNTKKPDEDGFQHLSGHDEVEMMTDETQRRLREWARDGDNEFRSDEEFISELKRHQILFRAEVIAEFLSGQPYVQPKKPTADSDSGSSVSSVSGDAGKEPADVSSAVSPLPDDHADYDMEAARKAGMTPERVPSEKPGGEMVEHWGSRIPTGPNEGLILKSPGHSTFGTETLPGEEKSGMRWFEDPDAGHPWKGRFWTFPKGQEPLRSDLTPINPPEATYEEPVPVAPTITAPGPEPKHPSSKPPQQASGDETVQRGLWIKKPSVNQFTGEKQEGQFATTNKEIIDTNRQWEIMSSKAAEMQRSTALLSNEWVRGNILNVTSKNFNTANETNLHRLSKLYEKRASVRGARNLPQDGGPVTYNELGETYSTFETVRGKVGPWLTELVENPTSVVYLRVGEDRNFTHPMAQEWAEYSVRSGQHRQASRSIAEQILVDSPTPSMSKKAILKQAAKVVVKNPSSQMIESGEVKAVTVQGLDDPGLYLHPLDAANILFALSADSRTLRPGSSTSEDVIKLKAQFQRETEALLDNGLFPEGIWRNDYGGDITHDYTDKLQIIVLARKAYGGLGREFIRGVVSTGPNSNNSIRLEEVIDGLPRAHEFEAASIEAVFNPNVDPLFPNLSDLFSAASHMEDSNGEFQRLMRFFGKNPDDPAERQWFFDAQHRAVKSGNP